jgi:hypothetical protein
LQQPEAQVLPAQQAVPAVPQVTQVLLLHSVLASVQVLPPQQGWPAAPQATHALFWHSVFAAVQVPLQQGWPAPPQLPHAPFWQTPRLVPQELPLLMQLPPTQQPPALHALPAQQTSPPPPHAAQVPTPAPLQTELVSVQTRPVQQGAPTEPQVWQRPPRHCTPAPMHVRLAQQGWPARPQATQVPLTQAVSGSLQPTPPGQQAVPLVPHAMHAPATQVPPVQAVPAAMQVPFWQQPPEAQVLPAQQAPPAPPQPRSGITIDWSGGVIVRSGTAIAWSGGVIVRSGTTIVWSGAVIVRSGAGAARSAARARSIPVPFARSVGVVSAVELEQPAARSRAKETHRRSVLISSLLIVDGTHLRAATADGEWSKEPRKKEGAGARSSDAEMNRAGDAARDQRMYFDRSSSSINLPNLSFT